VLVSQGTKLSSNEAQYDDAGRVTTSFDAAGQPTMFEYNKRGLQTAVINALNQRSETQYDAAGRAIISKDALSHQTRTTYDSAGRPVKMTSRTVVSSPRLTTTAAAKSPKPTNSADD